MYVIVGFQTAAKGESYLETRCCNREEVLEPGPTPRKIAPLGRRLGRFLRVAITRRHACGGKLGRGINRTAANGTETSGR